VGMWPVVGKEHGVRSRLIVTQTGVQLAHANMNNFGESYVD